MLFYIPQELLIKIFINLDIISICNLLLFSKLLLKKDNQKFLDFHKNIELSIKYTIIKQNTFFPIILRVKKSLKSYSIKTAMKDYSDLYFKITYKPKRIEVYEAKLLIKLIDSKLKEKNRLFLTICKKINTYDTYLAKKEIKNLHLNKRKIQLLSYLINS